MRIISGLVSMSEIEAGARSLSMASVDINILLQDMQKQNQPNTNVPIQLHLPEKQMLIHSDQLVITEIMDNLLQIIIKLSAILQFPIILSLVHRNYIAFVRTFHETSHFCF